MCRIVEEYCEKREKRGYAAGMIEGKKEGITEGMIKGKIEAVNEMLKDNIPFEIALGYAKIDPETYKKYNTQKLQ